MSVDVASLPVAVLVFSSPGCPMCSAYEPRFRAIAAKYARCVPAFVVNCDASGANAEIIDNRLQVKYTPTTLVARSGHVVGHKKVGALTDDEIERIFQRAMRGQGCEL